MQAGHSRYPSRQFGTCHRSPGAAATFIPLSKILNAECRGWGATRIRCVGWLVFQVDTGSLTLQIYDEDLRDPTRRIHTVEQYLEALSEKQ